MERLNPFCGTALHTTAACGKWSLQIIQQQIYFSTITLSACQCFHFALPTIPAKYTHEKRKQKNSAHKGSFWQLQALWCKHSDPEAWTLIKPPLDLSKTKTMTHRKCTHARTHTYIKLLKHSSARWYLKLRAKADIDLKGWSLSLFLSVFLSLPPYLCSCFFTPVCQTILQLMRASGVVWAMRLFFKFPVFVFITPKPWIVFLCRIFFKKIDLLRSFTKYY